MKKAVFNYVVDRPLITIVAMFMAIFAFAYGAQKLYFDGDYKVFFSDDNPQMLAFESMQNVYSKSDNLAIVITPKSGNVFEQQTLTQLYEMTEQAWQTPYSLRVDSITNFQHTQADYDDLLVEDLLLEKEMLSPSKIAKIKEVALSEPNLVNKLIAPDASVAIINVTIQLPNVNELTEIPEVAAFGRALKTEFEAKYPDNNIRLSGMIMLNTSFAEYAQNDSSTLIPAMFLAILVMLGILLRSISATFASLLVIVGSIAGALGISGWLGIPLTTATVNVPTIVMTLAVADCVHVISTLLFEMRAGKNKKEAIISSLEINLTPIFITSITTALGFLALNFSYSPPLADLGNLVAVGVMIAFVLAMTILPATLMFLPLRVKKSIKKTTLMDRFAEFVIKRSRIILPVSLLIIVALGTQTVNNHVSDDSLKYFSENTEFRQDADFMAKHVSGMTTLEFSLSSGKSSGINSPEFLNALSSFTDWLRAQPETDHVSSLSDTIKRLNQNMHNDDSAFYKIPDQSTLSAQYLLMYEMSLPYGLDLNGQINVKKSATRVIATFTNLGSIEILDLERRATQWFVTNAPNINIDIASTSSMFAHIGDRNMTSMIQGTALALVLISALVGISLQSFRLGFISLLPNLLPAISGFGLWAIISGEINLALSVVASLTLGIVVDDTVHFLSKYQRAKNQGKSPQDSVRYAFASVGRALIITTAILCIGFGILTQSDFAMNADMGLLTCIIILIALFVDLLLLPAFLIIFDRQKATQQTAINLQQQPVLAQGK
ncbi:RND transporter [Psychromonas sp. psych-6C06]|uniref:efflux RND transporter permease subunit n=1 Tax=Psychromonas sp. psych-6C06 TaxID=2058089 RepID=UPI000C349354|nr:MMPL family transporter [Psychromonas sp. psych-6C06]PKF62783.1 RND transporter [Psychromonas sp. psych-6C06]